MRTFQKTSLFGGRSVLDNVLIGLHLRSRQRPLAIMLGLPSVARDERALTGAAWEVLRFMGLEARADEPAAALPYGEQRLLEVAIALAARPEAPAARRAGVGHEPGREGALHGDAGQDPRAAASRCSWSSTTCAP